MKKINVSILVLLVSLLSIGCANQSEDVMAETEVIEAITVNTEIVSTETIEETFYGVGELKAKNEFEVMTGKSGTVETINVKVGDLVKKDQVLMKLNNDNLLATVNTNESNLRTQRSLNEIQLESAQIAFEQVKALFEMGAISQSEMDSASDNLSQAQLNYNNSANNYNQTMRNLNEEVSDTYVKSPIDGIVAAKYVTENQDVGNTVAFKIVNQEKMIAEIEVPETVVDSVKIGQKTAIYLNGNKDEAIEGSVTSIDAIPGDNSFLYPVEIELDNNDARLRSGMYVEVEITINEYPDRITIPKTALLGTQEEKYVFVDNGSYAEMRTVLVGRNKSKDVEIVDGLIKGDLLIVRGQEYVREGDYINGIEE